MDSQLLASGFDPQVFALDFWTILVAMVGNSACAIVGCYLVLRRMSMMGDAISHSMLAAIGVVFLLTRDVGFVPVFIGAVAVGVLTGVLTESLHRAADVPEDSSMGVVFTSLFAFGVVLISLFPQNDLDTNCVLLGHMEHVGLETMWQIKFERTPHELVRLLVVLAGTIAVVALFWKELKVSAFDPGLARAMGFRPRLMHYLLMALVASVTVTTMQSVGSIVVIAMLIVPAATAHLLTNRFGWMLVLSVIISWLAAIFGYIAATWVNSNAAGMMAVAAGCMFTLAVFFAPQHGLISRLLNNSKLRLRILGEDILAQMCRTEERSQGTAVAVSPAQCVDFAGGGLWGRLGMRQLQRTGAITVGETVELTDDGRRAGRSLLRSHRLWESYLDKHFDLDADHLHEPAHRVEHYIGPQMQDELERELDKADIDPHGREIPPAEQGRGDS